MHLFAPLSNIKLREGGEAKSDEIYWTMYTFGPVNCH
jgi:hypothetical protein